MLLFIIGPSASGKGTQAELLAEKFHVPHLSIGELLRVEVKEGTKLGNKIAPLLNEGLFIPGYIIDHILSYKLEEAFKSSGGAIVDGFPRLYGQAIDIQHEIDAFKGYFCVLHYNLTYEACYFRQLERIKLGGARSDDAKLRSRFDEYSRDVDAILTHYRKRHNLIEIDASLSVVDVFHDTCEKLYDYLKNYG